MYSGTSEYRTHWGRDLVVYREVVPISDVEWQATLFNQYIGLQVVK